MGNHHAMKLLPADSIFGRVLLNFYQRSERIYKIIAGKNVQMTPRIGGVTNNDKYRLDCLMMWAHLKNMLNVGSHNKECRLPKMGDHILENGDDIEKKFGVMVDNHGR